MRHLALPLLLSLVAGPASAAVGGNGLVVEPARLELGPRSGVAQLRLTNPGTDHVRYRLAAFTWAQERDGRMALGPAYDLELEPALVSLAPGESRTVRVTATAPPGDRERSWRLVVDRLPEDVLTDRDADLLELVGLPVFQAPPRPGPRVVETRLEAVNGRPGLVVANEGDTWCLVDELAIVGRDAAGRLTFTHTESAWYLLARGEREVELPVRGEACELTSRLHLTVHATWGTWEEELPFVGMPCSE